MGGAVMIELLNQWAARHGVPVNAVLELLHLMVRATLPDPQPRDALSEAAVQQSVRFDHAAKGGVLWRNNSGAMKDEYGNMIRYGLCNDSEKLNAVMKSADLIGITPVTITLEHVGTVIGQFTAFECKHATWTFKGTDREMAQATWLSLVQSKGGIGEFRTGV